MSHIILKDVCKSFGAVEVCKNINLSIDKGEFITLLGSSGCGKTTTLNMVAGLEDCSSGDILLDGKRINELSPVQRDAAMVFQNYALYPHMTVAQNIGFTLKMRGLDRSEIDRRVAVVAEALELGHVLQRLPGQLSGGQQQRVAIGRAIVREPRLFLFDEPFSNLDASLRVKTRAEIKQLHERLGVTSIFVTHDQEEALSISDRIAVMYQGRVEQFGSPDEIYLQPRTRYVATFIGNPQIELMPAELRVSDDASILAINDVELRLERRDLPKGTRSVEVGLRPEHVVLGDFERKAEVLFVQPVGPSTHVALRWAGGRLTASVPGFIRLNPGSQIGFDINLSHLFLFDQKTGLRV
ncbi:ABC transporter ATP-binding protein [Phyllobacterium zundukense]|uniref:ATP-binding cassette domain-containing protein n=1 Tax=Phyllobacterium zundukense TaxID=1867719 RepID=A0ACD4CVR9_9HYPH|nr:ATP-binding cassette domain-containing protein [Phyllobacterium zundukense]UXN57661.1 ATP-binding cassette domain-containing protein [Phyllobacterium zundukense]